MRSRKRRVRRLRRTNKQVMKFGWSAKSKHRSKSGRTGKIHSTHLKEGA